MQSLVSPEWQFILHEALGPELFDWQKDPRQLNNLAKTPEGHPISDEFALKLRMMRGEVSTKK